MASQITGNAEVAIHLYQALEGKAPSYALLNSYVAQMNNTSQAAWASQFGAGYTEDTTAFVTRVMANMGLTVANITQTGYDNLLAGAIVYFDSVGVAGRGVAVAQLGEIISNLENATGDLAIYKTAAVAYNNQSLGNFNYASNSANTNAAVVSPADSNVGQTYTLTTGVDSFTGATGNDTFNAQPGASNANTFTALDKVNGGAGTDTLNVTEIGAAGAAAYTLNAATTVSNIEVLNYTVSSDNAGDTLTADVSAYTGLTTANFTVSGTDAAMTITTDGNVATVTVTGGAAVGVTDTAADTLTSVTAVDASGLVTVTSDVLTTLVLNNSDAGATVSATAGTRALALSLSGIDGGVVADAEATSLAVTSSGTKTTAVTLNAAKAKTVSIASSVATTVTDVNVAAATSLTVTGTGATTVSALTTVTALTSIDSTGSTGGLTVGAAIGNAVTFSGGAGKDSVMVGATTKAITTADGDDTVTVVAVSALGTGGSIDAGAGTDTLKFSTYANAVSASAATTFEGTVSGFEKLNLSGINSAAAAAVNLANLDDINYVTLSNNNTATTTISNFVSGGTLAITSDQSAAATAVVTNANTGTADVFNLVLSKATALAGVDVVLSDIETVNVTSTETATTLLGTVTHAATLSLGTGTKSLTVAGNAGVTLGTLTGATALTSIDASGVTSGLVSFTTDALASAATIKGGAGANTIVATAATKAVTYTGSAKVDTITIDNAKANVIDTGAGNDVIVVGSGANTITAGDGNDTITVGAAAGLNTVNVGAGTDTVKLGGIQTAAGYYTSITGMGAGDIINFSTVATNFASVDETLGSKITLGGSSSFANYLDAAVAGSGGAMNWFQYGGNTYVTHDNSATATFADGVDSVVELVGLVDLSAATNVTGVLTLA